MANFDLIANFDEDEKGLHYGQGLRMINGQTHYSDEV